MKTNWQNLTTAQQRIDAIKSVWHLGASAAGIGAALGITRNAVIGMYGRHKAAMAGYPLGGGERPVQAKANSPHKQATKQKRKRLKATAKAVRVINPDEGPRNVPMIDLGKNGCLWATNDAARGEKHLFCGHARMEGCSYCERHAALAYQHKDTGQDKGRIAA